MWRPSDIVDLESGVETSLLDAVAAAGEPTDLCLQDGATFYGSRSWSSSASALVPHPDRSRTENVPSGAACVRSAWLVDAVRAARRVGWAVRARGVRR